MGFGDRLTQARSRRSGLPAPQGAPTDLIVRAHQAARQPVETLQLFACGAVRPSRIGGGGVLLLALAPAEHGDAGHGRAGTGGDGAVKGGK